MYKSRASLVFAFCLACSGAGEAAYVIKLGNGNEFVTGRYWHERTQVMFDVYGGVFGIDRAFVTKIEESNKTLKLEGAAREDPKDKPQTEQAEEAKEIKKPTTPAEAKVEVERNDDAITKEFNRLKEKSKGVNGMLTSEIRELLMEVTAFKNKILRDSKLFIKYAREFNDAQEIGNVTENALTSRNQ
jgi:FtsZ-interacting cell division protein YlmF